jgi:hypothetical protein
VAEDAGIPSARTVSPALQRLLPRIGGIETVARLTALSGSDFTSVMLEVMRRRAARETPASVLRRYHHDRFVRPGTTPWRSLRQVEDVLLGCLPESVEVMTLAPLVPLGAHSVLGTVSQDKIVTAVRACEVAADPTNALALEAAERRMRAGGTVRLAAVQRVVRAQQIAGAGRSAHFSLLGLVTAGRDEGSYVFERHAVAEHLSWAARGLAAAGLAEVQLAVTPLSEAGERMAAAVAEELSALPVEIVADRDRQTGRGYYRDLCFKVNARAGGEQEELGDGGLTDWTQKLTTSSKERLLISGVGIDRLAQLAGES